MVTITLIGDPGTGKTSIKKVLLGRQFQRNELITVGSEYTFHKLKVDQGYVKLKICDIAGQTTYETMRVNYMANSDAAVLVFDLTNSFSFLHLDQWINEYLQANVNARTNLPIILVGNKNDLENKIQVKMKDVRQFLERINSDSTVSNHIVGYKQVSAKLRENISSCFQKLVQSIIFNNCQ